MRRYWTPTNDPAKDADDYDRDLMEENERDDDEEYWKEYAHASNVRRWADNPYD